jgi:hypothetical protein
MVSNDTDQKVVKSIVDIARSLDKKTIAEGVEDAATLTALGQPCSRRWLVPLRYEPRRGGACRHLARRSPLVRLRSSLSSW